MTNGGRWDARIPHFPQIQETRRFFLLVICGFPESVGMFSGFRYEEVEGLPSAMNFDNGELLIPGLLQFPLCIFYPPFFTSLDWGYLKAANPWLVKDSG